MPQVSCAFRTFIGHPFNDYRAGHNALEESVSLSLKTLCGQPATHIQNPSSLRETFTAYVPVRRIPWRMNSKGLFRQPSSIENRGLMSLENKFDNRTTTHFTKQDS